MVGQLARTVQRGLRTTGHSNNLTTQPPTSTTKDQWKNRTDRRHLHAPSPTPAQNPPLPPANTSVVDPG